MLYDCSTNIEFQCVSGLFVGLLFGPLSMGIEYMILWIIVFELWVFATTSYKSPYERFISRLLINVFFLIGWVFSRWFYNDCIGHEKYLDDIRDGC